MPQYLDPCRVGNKVIIRTVTLYYTGEIVDINPKRLLLINCAWIAEVGRFAAALETGDLSEVEPYPEGAVVYVSMDIVSDITDWKHELPTQVK